MKKILLCLAFAGVFAFAPTVSLTAQETQQQPADREVTPLGKEMKQMNRAFRALGRDIGDPSKNSTSLKRVANMRKAAQASLRFKPEKTADLPAADQARFVADFKTGIKKLIADLDKLTAALKANDNASAAKILRQLKEDQKQGHKKFRKEHATSEDETETRP